MSERHLVAGLSGAEERLKVSGKPSQYDDLGVFVEEQAILRDLAAASRLPVLEIDAGDGDVAGAVDRIADWLTATGGLWAPGPDPYPAGSPTTNREPA